MPHEYQWTVAGFHITEPIQYGNPSPAPLAGNAAFQITTTHTFKRIELVTSGVWTDVRRSSPGFPNPVIVNWSNVGLESEPLVGPFGLPDKTRDWQWLADRELTPPCLKTIGGAFQRENIGSATTPTVQTANMRTTPNLVFKAPGSLPTTAEQRVSMAVPQPPTGTGTDLSMHGYVMRDGGVPGFVRRRKLFDSVPPLDAPTDRPVMVELLACSPAKTQGVIVYDQPELANLLTPANYYESSRSRTTTGGPVVTSALQAISLLPELAFAAPLATAVTFAVVDPPLELLTTGPDFGVVELGGAQRFIELRWSPETTTGTSLADDWEITLYGVNGTTLTPLHVYHVVDPKVLVDSSVFGGANASVMKFIFKIVSHVGVPDAKSGDFSKRTYPYSAATNWTYGFARL